MVLKLPKAKSSHYSPFKIAYVASLTLLSLYRLRCMLCIRVTELVTPHPTHRPKTAKKKTLDTAHGTPLSHRLEQQQGTLETAQGTLETAQRTLETAQGTLETAQEIPIP
jgi:hypothetical protein